MDECVIAISTLKEAASGSRGRISVDVQRTRAFITFRQVLLEAVSGFKRGEAVITFEAARTFGDRVRFELPLALQISGAMPEDEGPLSAVVTEWLFELTG